MKNINIHIVAMLILLGSLNTQKLQSAPITTYTINSLHTLGATLLASSVYGKYMASQQRVPNEKDQKYNPSFIEQHYGKMAATGATLLAISQALRRPETMGNLLTNAQTLVADAYDKIGLLKDTAIETGKAAGQIAQDAGNRWMNILKNNVDYYTSTKKARNIENDIKIAKLQIAEQLSYLNHIQRQIESSGNFDPKNDFSQKIMVLKKLERQLAQLTENFSLNNNYNHNDIFNDLKNITHLSSIESFMEQYKDTKKRKNLLKLITKSFSDENFD